MKKEKELHIPNIAIAAKSLDAIKRRADIGEIVGYDLSDAVASRSYTRFDEVIIWARPTLRAYRSVWESAVRMGYVEDDDWATDIDHVFPKSWASLDAFDVGYVRLYPVWSEVNRSAGGGRERMDPYSAGFTPNRQRNGIYFADDLQLLKMLGHEIPSTRDRTPVFKPLPR